MPRVVELSGSDSSSSRDVAPAGKAKKGGAWKGGVHLELYDEDWTGCVEFDKLIDTLLHQGDTFIKASSSITLYSPSTGELIHRDQSMTVQSPYYFQFDPCITEISTYITPLKEWLWSHFNCLYHEFVVFKAGVKWYSVEKHGDRITLQRGNTQSSVKDYARRNKRLKGNYNYLNWKVKVNKSDNGTKTIRECMEVLEHTSYITSSYHYLFNNCQSFATALFNFLTRVD